MENNFRRYLPADREQCLDVFASNIPRYFRDHERDEFASFLDSGESKYYVIELGKVVAGCGGFAVRPECELADLCWGMVSQAHHGTRLGEFLLLGRLDAIVADKHVSAVRLGTSQHTEGFFEKYGFSTQSRKTDGISAGLDDVEMRLAFTEPIRKEISERWSVALNEFRIGRRGW